MRAKNAVGTLLKSTVDVCVKLPQYVKCVLDTGHLLYFLSEELMFMSNYLNMPSVC